MVRKGQEAGVEKAFILGMVHVFLLFEDRRVNRMSGGLLSI